MTIFGVHITLLRAIAAYVIIVYLYLKLFGVRWLSAEEMAERQAFALWKFEKWKKQRDASGIKEYNSDAAKAIRK